MRFDSVTRGFLQSVRRCLAVTSCVGFAAWACGQVLRDRSWLTGLMFYIPSPLVLCAACFVVAKAVISQFSRVTSTGAPAARRSHVLWKRLYHTIAAATLLSSLIMIVCVENRWTQSDRELPAALSPPNAQEAAVRLVHWNLGHPRERWKEQRDILLALNADILALSEATEVIRPEDLAGYTITTQGGLLLAVRGESDRLDNPRGRLVPGGVVDGMIVRCQLENHVAIDVLLADHTSNIMIARDRWLRALMEVAVVSDVDVLVGDLNAPRRSRALDPLPGEFSHAYDESGSGWSYTWPVPVPAFAIDQCVVGNRLTCLSYRLESHLLSDHRLQILDFSVRTPIP